MYSYVIRIYFFANIFNYSVSNNWNYRLSINFIGSDRHRVSYVNIKLKFSCRTLKLSFYYYDGFLFLCLRTYDYVKYMAPHYNSGSLSVQLLYSTASLRLY